MRLYPYDGEETTDDDQGNEELVQISEGNEIEYPFVVLLF